MLKHPLDDYQCEDYYGEEPETMIVTYTLSKHPITSWHRYVCSNGLVSDVNVAEDPDIDTQ